MLDKFGKLVRDIRITRSLLLYDMAKTLGISPAEPTPFLYLPRIEVFNAWLRKIKRIRRAILIRLLMRP